MMMEIAVRRKGRRRGWDEGAAAVEAAIILNVLLLLIFGIIEFGTALWQWNTMQLAVQQAGRYAMIKSGASPPCDTSCAETQMQAVLTSAAICTTPTAGQICVSASTSAGSPSTMTLTAKYNINFVALAGAFTITSQATFPLD
jgi:Flp pilus assembly protein TadG